MIHKYETPFLSKLNKDNLFWGIEIPKEKLYNSFIK